LRATPAIGLFHTILTLCLFIIRCQRMCRRHE